MVAPFEPAWWCRNAHLQTVLPNRLRLPPRVPLHRERMELPDGDFVDIDWTTRTSGPIVLLLHGLQGSSRSLYALGLLRALDRAGWRAGVVHFRGCSGEPNRLARSYHSGETEDIGLVALRIREREPDAILGAVGVSLGGNVLLKWLGETGAASPLSAAVAISVPLLLDRAADRLENGFARVYQWDLITALRRALHEKHRVVELPFDFKQLKQLRRMREFDDYVTAPLHGFRDSADYYMKCSSRQYLRHIRVPTLLIQAKDDPFMSPDVIPERNELSASVTLEAHEHGGHVGFLGGKWPWRPRFYLEERVPDFLQAHLTRPQTLPIAQQREQESVG